MRYHNIFRWVLEFICTLLLIAILVFSQNYFRLEQTDLADIIFLLALADTMLTAVMVASIFQEENVGSNDEYRSVHLRILLTLFGNITMLLYLFFILITMQKKIYIPTSFHLYISLFCFALIITSEVIKIRCKVNKEDQLKKEKQEKKV
ncbi:hypothetical protein [Guggenheimella bovis]